MPTRTPVTPPRKRGAFRCATPGQGQDNDAGITVADFVTKPVRFDELLEWLGTRPALQWLAAPLQASAPHCPPAASVAARGPAPSREQLQPLQQVPRSS